MAVKVKNLKKRLKRLWESSKKEFDKLTREASVLLKQGEKTLKKVERKSQENLELVNATLRREKLYYQLGKTLAGKSKGQWSTNKGINSLTSEIHKLGREIQILKKKR